MSDGIIFLGWLLIWIVAAIPLAMFFCFMCDTGEKEDECAHFGMEALPGNRVFNIPAQMDTTAGKHI